MTEPRPLNLAHLPTPLEPIPRFSSEIAGRKVWIKRDDCTGLAFGGNKARKLEYLLASAREAGADVVITFGGVQSNHTRSTAAAARKIGMDCDLVLAGSPPGEVEGNLLLNRVLGATLTFLSLRPEDLTPGAVAAALASAEERLRGKGRRPYTIGPGGSTPLGTLGYRAAFDEMLSQARSLALKVDHVLVAFGTGGTLAGLVLGNVLAGRPVRVTGISVAPPGMPDSLGVPPVRVLVEQAAALLGLPIDLAEDDVRIIHDYAGRAYAVPTTQGTEAIRALARTEGIFLDPVYTGKAMAGLLGMCRSAEIGPDQTTVFFHTGGTPALFAYKKVLAP
ncbi:MAG: 1-aminocyclopropane-1-carboxylate deaminase/D-cysteine desulfhydrase [Acidobacteriota bacterium]